MEWQPWRFPARTAGDNGGLRGDADHTGRLDDDSQSPTSDLATGAERHGTEQFRPSSLLGCLTKSSDLGMVGVGVVRRPLLVRNLGGPHPLGSSHRRAQDWGGLHHYVFPLAARCSHRSGRGGNCCTGHVPGPSDLRCGNGAVRRGAPKRSVHPAHRLSAISSYEHRRETGSGRVHPLYAITRGWLALRRWFLDRLRKRGVKWLIWIGRAIPM